MSKVDEIFEEIDEIYGDWNGGELHIGKERIARIKEVLTTQLCICDDDNCTSSISKKRSL